MLNSILKEQLQLEPDAPAKGTILEVKEEKGLGVTVDAVIYDGILRKNDTIVLTSRDNVITTKIRSLLKPRPLEEMRDSKKRFLKVDEVVAAAGIKIVAPKNRKRYFRISPQGCKGRLRRGQRRNNERN